MTGIYNNKYDILASTIKPNPNSVKYWADLSSNPNGGDLKYFDGKDWVYVNNQASEDIKDLQANLANEINRATSAEQTIDAKITALIGDAPDILDTLPELIDEIASKATQESVDTLNSTVSALSTTVASKVDKEEGKGLSTNDFTTEEKNKLAGLSNYDDTTINADIANVEQAIEAAAQDITELETSLDNKLDKDGAKVLSDNNYTTAEKEKLASLNNYTLPQANDATMGGITLGYTSTDTTKAVQVDENGKAYVDISGIQFDINDIPEAESLYSYGVSWETGSLNATLVRIGNLDLHRSLPIQNAMRGCTLADDGTVNHYFNADWSANEDGSEIKKDGSDGMVMIEIPEFYVKCTEKNGISSMSISQYAIDGFTLVKKQYVSAYEAAVDRTDTSALKLASVQNTTATFRGGNNDETRDSLDTTQLGMPLTSTSRANFRNYARNRGANWNMLDFFATNAVWLLFTIEYATWNSQAAVNNTLTTDGFKQGGLGNGVSTLVSSEWNTFNGYYPLVPCGTSDSLGNGTGEVDYTLPASYKADSTVTVKVNRYRGIEMPFGHLWKNVDGIIFDIKTDADGGTSTIYLADAEANYGDTITEHFTEVGQLPRVNAYISNTFIGTFLPSAAAGAGSTTGRCDYFYTNIDSSSLRTLFYGGFAGHGAGAGFGCVYSIAAVGGTSAYCGSRLVFRA